MDKYHCYFRVWAQEGAGGIEMDDMGGDSGRIAGRIKSIHCS